jgi:Glycosyltransferase
MSATNIILKITNFFKPLLKKIVPIKLLRWVKESMMSRKTNAFIEQGIQPLDIQKYPKGMNLIGNIKAEIGLGQSCRLVAAQIEQSSLLYSVYNFRADGNIREQDNSFEEKIQSILPYSINLFHINPYELDLACLELKKESWDFRYNIGFWLWELEDFPEKWTRFFPLLNEIWTPSQFITDSIKKKTDKPVKTVPYCVTAPIDEKYDRTYFNLPKDIFLFLTMYDAGSTMERKNPMGAIHAYKKAFGKEDKSVGLVIKINNSKKEDIAILKDSLKGYANIHFITETLEKVQVNSLIKQMNTFVSLHRAEGFGLVLAEAMLVGVPTIATNWSSNTEFMNPEVACMVDYEIVEIKKICGQYKVGQKWAEPSVDMAAEYMKKLYEDKKFCNQISSKALSYITEKLSMENAVRLIEARIDEIYRENGEKG